MGTYIIHTCHSWCRKNIDANLPAMTKNNPTHGQQSNATYTSIGPWWQSSISHSRYCPKQWEWHESCTQLICKETRKYPVLVNNYQRAMSEFICCHNWDQLTSQSAINPEFCEILETHFAPNILPFTITQWHSHFLIWEPSADGMGALNIRFWSESIHTFNCLCGAIFLFLW